MQIHLLLSTMVENIPSNKEHLERKILDILKAVYREQKWIHTSYFFSSNLCPCNSIFTESILHLSYSYLNENVSPRHGYLCRHSSSEPKNPSWYRRACAAPTLSSCLLGLLQRPPSPRDTALDFQGDALNLFSWILFCWNFLKIEIWVTLGKLLAFSIDFHWHLGPVWSPPWRLAVSFLNGVLSLLEWLFTPPSLDPSSLPVLPYHSLRGLDVGFQLQ